MGNSLQDSKYKKKDQMERQEYNENFLKGLTNPKREEHPRSLLGLIELGTLDLDLASVSHISRGDSYLTSSRARWNRKNNDDAIFP